MHDVPRKDLRRPLQYWKLEPFDIHLENGDRGIFRDDVVEGPAFHSQQITATTIGLGREDGVEVVTTQVSHEQRLSRRAYSATIKLNPVHSI